MSKTNWRKSGVEAKLVRRDSMSGKLSEVRVKSLAGAALTQRVSKSLKSANTITQTFKPKNAR
jgi:hypothetical protein